MCEMSAIEAHSLRRICYVCEKGRESVCVWCVCVCVERVCVVCVCVCVCACVCVCVFIYILSAVEAHKMCS